MVGKLDQHESGRHSYFQKVVFPDSGNEDRLTSLPCGAIAGLKGSVQIGVTPGIGLLHSIWHGTTEKPETASA